MSRNGTRRAGSLEEIRVGLAERLRSRRSEIEHAIFAYAGGASDLLGGEDAEYLVGLRTALTAALDYVLEGIELGDESSGPIPSVVAAQARRVARNGVDLETLLLRCAAGHRVLVGFVITEADGLPTRTLGQVLDLQWVLVERLIAEVSIEHKRELDRAGRSPEHRHSELVRGLLTGEPLDTAELGYDLAAWHVGVIATGAGAREVLRAVAAGADRQLLVASPDDQTVWGWLGGKRALAFADLERLVPPTKAPGVSLALGEPGRGIDGWRLTHRQAQAAMLVELHKPRRLVRYAEEMLLAAALRDETLARSLREIYLSPLAAQRDGGAVSRATLRAYFEAGRNATEAGVRLGIVRQTVEQRLRTVDHVLGRALGTCLIELEVALRLDDLDE